MRIHGQGYKIIIISHRMHGIYRIGLVGNLMLRFSKSFSPMINNKQGGSLRLPPLHPNQLYLLHVHTCTFYSVLLRSYQSCEASAMTAVRRDPLVLTSNAPWTDIQLLVSQGQIRFR